MEVGLKKTGFPMLPVGGKVKLKWIDRAPSGETSIKKRSGMDHTVLPANYTMLAFTT